MTREAGFDMPRPCEFTPVLAHTRTVYSAVEPTAFDCMKIIVVRSGGALLLSEFGPRHVNVGDVVLLESNTLCGAEPEGFFTTTTLFVDRDYVIDQVFWQYAATFSDRLDAGRLLEAFHTPPARIVRIGEHRADALSPWLDELVTLTLDGDIAGRFYRAQSLLSAILDVVVPRSAVEESWTVFARRGTAAPTPHRRHLFRPLRPEAREIADLLRGDIARRWSVRELTEVVHLSPSQLRRVFVEAFGKAPIAYLTMLRAERMAHLLRTTDAAIAVIASEVGWGDPDFAARQFRRRVGVSPREYRRMGREMEPRDPPGVNARRNRAKRS